MWFNKCPGLEENGCQILGVVHVAREEESSLSSLNLCSCLLVKVRTYSSFNARVFVGRFVLISTSSTLCIQLYPGSSLLLLPYIVVNKIKNKTLKLNS